MEKDKVSKTAEMVSLIRSETGQDTLNKIFVSKSTYRKYGLIKKLLPDKKIKELFMKRISLSKEIDKQIKKYKPKQVIELASGYSLRGYYLTKKNKNLIWIDTDLSQVIERKKKIMMKNSLSFPENYHLISHDIFQNNLYEKTNKYLNKKKPTLIIAEGLISYLNEKEFELLIKNISLFFTKSKGSFLSHEKPIGKNKQITSGSIGSLLRKYITLVTKRKSQRHFNSEKELIDYFRKKGFSKVKILDKDYFIFLTEY